MFRAFPAQYEQAGGQPGIGGEPQIVQLVPDHERRFGQKPMPGPEFIEHARQGLAAKARRFRRVRAPHGIRKNDAVRPQKLFKPFLACRDSLFREIPPAHAGLVGYQEKAVPRPNQARQRRADAGQQDDAGRLRKVMLILNEPSRSRSTAQETGMKNPP